MDALFTPYQTDSKWFHQYRSCNTQASTHFSPGGEMIAAHSQKTMFKTATFEVIVKFPLITSAWNLP
jgi:uncharacterized protein (DUF1330 family)